MALTLHLVRHGQSEWNLIGRLQGQTPHPSLSELGRRQASAAAARLAGFGPVDRLLTSDLIRAVQTAAPIAAATGISAALEPRLRERGMGHLEGLTSVAAFEAAAGADWSDPHARLGGDSSESARDVYLRVGSLLAELMAELMAARRPRTVVLVSHGDAIRVAANWLADTAVAGEFNSGGLVLTNGSITTAELLDGVLVRLTQTLPGID